IPIKAGPHTVSASFITRADGPADDFLEPPERSLGDDFRGQTPGLTSLPHLRELSIAGPYRATGVSETPSRRRISPCHPAAVSQEASCARRILSSVAQRAFRRSVSPSSFEEVMSAYRDGRRRGTFETGIRLALQFILASPEFVFRFEYTP